MGCSGPLGHRQWHWDSSASYNSCASIPVLIPFPCPVPVSGAAQGSRFTGWDGWRKPGQKGYVGKKVLWSFLGCPATTPLMRVEMTLGPSLLLNCAYLHALPPCFYLGSPFSLDVLPFPPFSSLLPPVVSTVSAGVLKPQLPPENIWSNCNLTNTFRAQSIAKQYFYNRMSDKSLIFWFPFDILIPSPSAVGGRKRR